MIPQALALCSLHHRPGESPRLVPHFFTEGDRPWIRLFYGEFLRLEGRPRRDFVERFAEPLPFAAPARKRELLFQLLLRLSSDDAAERLPRGLRARSLRAQLFGRAAQSEAKERRERAIDAVSAQTGIAPEELLTRAFSDLRLQRPVVGIPGDLSPESLQLRANLALAQSLLARSASISLRARGNARSLVRQAKLRRLICTVIQPGSAGDPVLEVSGPLSIFGHTLLYGRALAELLPIAAWCGEFELSALCRVRGREGVLELGSRDPIQPSSEPRLFDSKVEIRFARDFLKAQDDWDLIREPEAVPVPGVPPTLIFPDFMLQHRRDPRLRWWVEIIGFWTPEYLERKLARLRAARLDRLLLLVDQSLTCSKAPELPAGAQLLCFKRKVDVAEVLRAINGPTSS